MQNVPLVGFCGMAAVRWPRSTIGGALSTGGPWTHFKPTKPSLWRDSWQWALPEKERKSFSDAFDVHGLHCCESSSPAWRARPWCVYQESLSGVKMQDDVNDFQELMKAFFAMAADVDNVHGGGESHGTLFRNISTSTWTTTEEHETKLTHRTWRSSLPSIHERVCEVMMSLCGRTAVR